MGSAAVCSCAREQLKLHGVRVWGGQGSRVTITGFFFFKKKKGITQMLSSNWKIENVLPACKDSRLVPLSFLSILW